VTGYGRIPYLMGSVVTCEPWRDARMEYIASIGVQKGHAIEGSPSSDCIVLQIQQLKSRRFTSQPKLNLEPAPLSEVAIILLIFAIFVCHSV
jgi:hypothetical protein